MSNYYTADTICAISTPQGSGAIGIVRLSGAKSIHITEQIFKGKKLSQQKANTLHYGKIVSGNEVIDEVVVSLFKGPASYTGEDIVEVSCHGSKFIQSEILKLLIQNGARMAGEGEFTFRAYLNGKLDLSQAEAVADLISADSKASKDLAFSQLRGGYSIHLKDLRSKLIDFASLLELELDFAEEDVAFANRTELKKLLEEIINSVGQLLKSFEQGNVLKHGLPVVIIGKPNVGKSTLLNAILKEERAIVSDIPGTTRDYIEDSISIGGVMFRFTDTAGIRETKDEIEIAGILKTKEKADKAKIVLHLIDTDNIEESITEFKRTSSENSILVINKSDNLSESDRLVLEKKYSDLSIQFISAKTGFNIDVLLEKLLSSVNQDIRESSGVIVSNARHAEALMKSKENMERALDGLNQLISSEFISMDIRQTINFLGEITGEVSNEELLGNIFSRFCIGK